MASVGIKCQENPLMSRSAQPSHRVPGCLSKAEHSLHSGLTKVCRAWATWNTPLHPRDRELPEAPFPAPALQGSSGTKCTRGFQHRPVTGQRAISAAGNVISGVHSVTIRQP